MDTSDISVNGLGNGAMMSLTPSSSVLEMHRLGLPGQRSKMPHHAVNNLNALPRGFPSLFSIPKRCDTSPEAIQIHFRAVECFCEAFIVSEAVCYPVSPFVKCLQCPTSVGLDVSDV